MSEKCFFCRECQDYGTSVFLTENMEKFENLMEANQIDKNALKECQICKDCNDIICSFFDYKSTFMEKEDELLNYISSENKVDLCQVLVTKGKLERYTDLSAVKVCRICFEPTKVDVYKEIRSYESGLAKVVSTCFPEIDIFLTYKTFICQNCDNKLLKYYHFLLSCIEAIKKIDQSTDPMSDPLSLDFQPIVKRQKMQIEPQPQNVNVEEPSTPIESLLIPIAPPKRGPGRPRKNKVDGNEEPKKVTEGSKKRGRKRKVIEAITPLEKREKMEQRTSRREYITKEEIKEKLSDKNIKNCNLSYECHICPCVLDSFEAMSEHTKFHNKPLDKFMCYKCDTLLYPSPFVECHFAVHGLEAFKIVEHQEESDGEDQYGSSTKKQNNKSDMFAPTLPKSVLVPTLPKSVPEGRELIECQLCRKQLRSSLLFQKHIQAHELNSVYICLKCKYSYFGIVNMQRHLKEAHATPNLFKIIPCHQSQALEEPKEPLPTDTFTEKEQTSPEQSLRCQSCSKDFNNLDDYTSHTCTKTTEYCCGHCSGVFYSLDELDEHTCTPAPTKDTLEANKTIEVENKAKQSPAIDSSHTQTIPEDAAHSSKDTDYECSFCLSSFLTLRALDRHHCAADTEQPTHRKITCHKCEAHFNSYDDLSKHSCSTKTNSEAPITVQKGDLYQCFYCHTVLESLNEFSVHRCSEMGSIGSDYVTVSVDANEQPVVKKEVNDIQCYHCSAVVDSLDALSAHTCDKSDSSNSTDSCAPILKRELLGIFDSSQELESINAVKPEPDVPKDNSDITEIPSSKAEPVLDGEDHGQLKKDADNTEAPKEVQEIKDTDAPDKVSPKPKPTTTEVLNRIASMFGVKIFADGQTQNKVETFQCIACDFKAPTKKDLWFHVNYCEKIKKCHYCSYQTDNSQKLEIHCYTVHDIIVFSCIHCRFITSMEENFRDHNMSVHGSKEDFVDEESNCEWIKISEIISLSTVTEKKLKESGLSVETSHSKDGKDKGTVSKSVDKSKTSPSPNESEQESGVLSRKDSVNDKCNSVAVSDDENDSNIDEAEETVAIPEKESDKAHGDPLEFDTGTATDGTHPVWLIESSSVETKRLTTDIRMPRRKDSPLKFSNPSTSSSNSSAVFSEEQTTSKHDANLRQLSDGPAAKSENESDDGSVGNDSNSEDIDRDANLEETLCDYTDLQNIETTSLDTFSQDCMEDEDENDSDNINSQVAPSVSSFSENPEAADETTTDDTVESPDVHNILNKEPTVDVTYKTLCIFCYEEVAHFPRHLRRKHLDEESVREIIMLPPKSRARKEAFTVLRKKGNFFLARQNNQVRPVRLSQSSTNAEDFFPCIYCLGYYSKQYLSRHIKTCTLRDESASSRYHLSKSQTFQTSTGVLGNFLNTSRLKNEVLNIMRADKISHVAKTDPLICLYGESFFAHDTVPQLNTISNKMREVARLKVALQSTVSFGNLIDVLQPKYYKDITTAVKIISGFDPDTETFKAYSLALHMGTRLRHICKLAEEALRRKDVLFGSIEDSVIEERCQGIEDLSDKIRLQWNSEFTNKVSIEKTKCEPPKIIALTKDVKLFNDYVMRLANDALEKLGSCEDQQKNYRNLVENTFTLVLIFNRKKIEEVQFMDIETYTRGAMSDVVEEECLTSLTNVEKTVCNNFKKVIVFNRDSKPVIVFFTKQMQTFIDALLEARKSAGFVPEDNKYVFAYPGSRRWVSGYAILRKAAFGCSVENPQYLTGSSFRTYVGTIMQLMHFERTEMEMLARLIGYTDEETPSEFYRLSEDINHTAKLVKVLLMLNIGKGIDFEGKKLIDIELTESDLCSDVEVTETVSKVDNETADNNELSEGDADILESANSRSSEPLHKTSTTEDNSNVLESSSSQLTELNHSSSSVKDTERGTSSIEDNLESSSIQLTEPNHPSSSAKYSEPKTLLLEEPSSSQLTEPKHSSPSSVKESELKTSVVEDNSNILEPSSSQLTEPKHASSVEESELNTSVNEDNSNILEPSSSKSIKPELSTSPKELKQSNRIKWTAAQKKAVLRHFKGHIEKKILPKKKDCIELIEKESDLFEDVCWSRIKILVYNTYRNPF